MTTFLQILNKSSGDGDETTRHTYTGQRATNRVMDQNVEVILSPTSSQIIEILADPEYPMGLTSNRVYFRPQKSAKFRRYSRQTEYDRLTQGVNSPEAKAALSKQEQDSMDDLLLHQKMEENLGFHTRAASASKSRSARGKRSLSRTSSSSIGKKGGFYPKSSKLGIKRSMSPQDVDQTGPLVLTSLSDTHAKKKYYDKLNVDKILSRRQSIADDGKLSLRPKGGRKAKSQEPSRRASKEEMELLKKKALQGKSKSFDIHIDGKTDQPGLIERISPLDFLGMPSKQKKTSADKGHLLLPVRSGDRSSISSRKSVDRGSSTRGKEKKGKEAAVAKPRPRSSTVKKPKPKAKGKNTPKGLRSAESVVAPSVSLGVTESKDTDVHSLSSQESLPSMWNILSKTTVDKTKEEEEEEYQKELRRKAYIARWQWAIQEIIRRNRRMNGSMKKTSGLWSHVFRWDDFVDQDDGSKDLEATPGQAFDDYKLFLEKNKGAVTYLKYYSEKRKNIHNERALTTEIKSAQVKSTRDAAPRSRRDSIVQKGGKPISSNLPSESQSREVSDSRDLLGVTPITSRQSSGSPSMESRKVSRTSEVSSSSMMSDVGLISKEDIAIGRKGSKLEAAVESKRKRASRRLPTTSQSKELMYTEQEMLRPTVTGSVISNLIAATEEYKREKQAIEKIPTKAKDIEEEEELEKQARVTPRYVRKTKRLHDIRTIVSADGVLIKKASSDSFLHLASSGIALGNSKSDSKVSFDEVADAKWKLDEMKNRFLGHRTPFAIHWTESSMDLTKQLQPSGLLQAIRDLTGTHPVKQITPSVGPQEKSALQPTASQVTVLQKSHVKRGVSKTISGRTMSDLSLIGLPDTEEDYQEFDHPSGKKRKKTKKHQARASETDLKAGASQAHVAAHGERRSELDLSGKRIRKKPHGYRTRSDNVLSQESVPSKVGRERAVTSMPSLDKKPSQMESEQIVSKEASIPSLEKITGQKASERIAKKVSSVPSLEKIPSKKPSEKFARKVSSIPSLAEITPQKASERMTRRVSSIPSIEKVSLQEASENIMTKLIEKITSQKEKVQAITKETAVSSRGSIHAKEEGEIFLPREGKATTASSVTSAPSYDDIIVPLPKVPSSKEIKERYVDSRRRRPSDSERVHETLGSSAQYSEDRFDVMRRAPSSSMSDSSVEGFRREIMERSRHDLSAQQSLIGIHEDDVEVAARMTRMTTAARNVYQTQSKTLLQDKLSASLLKASHMIPIPSMDSESFTRRIRSETPSGLPSEVFDVVGKRSEIIREGFLRTKSGMEMMKRGSYLGSAAASYRQDDATRKLGSKEVLPPITQKEEPTLFSKESLTSTITYPSDIFSIRSGVTSSAYQYGQPSDANVGMLAPEQFADSLISAPSSVRTRKSFTGVRYQPPSYIDLGALEQYREEKLYERLRNLHRANAFYQPMTHVLVPLQARLEKKFYGWDLEKPSKSPPQGHGLYQEYIDTVPTILKAMSKTKECKNKLKHEADSRRITDNTLRSASSDCINYAAFHGLEQLFEFLLTNVVLHKPSNPLNYLIDLTRSILTQMTLRVTMDMMLKNHKQDDVAKEETPSDSPDKYTSPSRTVLAPIDSIPELASESDSMHSLVSGRLPGSIPASPHHSSIYSSSSSSSSSTISTKN